MGREILFRAKRIDNEEWVEGCLLIDYVSGQYFIHASGNSVNESDKVNEDGCLKFFSFEIDSKTVCQYTGLIDETEKKIYEGDIVKTSQYGVDDGNGHNYAGFDTFSVKFSDGGFCLKNEWRIFNLRPLGNFEVIGNIFDDPELIED